MKKLILKSCTALALIMGGGASQSALANDNNPNHIMMQQQYGLDCSRRLDGCQGQGGSSGGNVVYVYKEPKGKPTYIWVAIHSTQTPHNPPMFYSLKVYLKGSQLADKYLERLKIYGLLQCEKRYGKTCSVLNGAYGGKNSYVVVDRLTTQGGKYNHGISWTHDGKAKTEQYALQGCQTYAKQNGHNPNDCRVASSTRFDRVDNQISDKKSHILYSDEIDQDPRLPCSALIDAKQPACEQRRLQNGR